MAHDLTPAGPSSLPNPKFRRFVSSLCPHRAHPAPGRPCQATRAGRRWAGRFVGKNVFGRVRSTADFARAGGGRPLRRRQRRLGDSKEAVAMCLLPSYIGPRRNADEKYLI